MAAQLGRAKPTKGFLLELKKRIAFVEEGYKLLELKREELAKTIRTYLEILEAKRTDLERRAADALQKMTATYAFLGSGEAETQAESAGEKLSVQILPKSVMGCVIPYVKDFRTVEVREKMGPALRSVAKDFEALISDLIKVAEVEASIERIAEELGATNRKVNALEKIIIPEMETNAKYIEDMLDEEMMEEVVRVKIIRTMLERKRA